MPEHPALASQMHHEQSCLKSSARPMPDPDLNVSTDVNVDIDADLPENSAPMMNSDLIVLELDDAIRREVLGGRTTKNMSSCGIDDRLLSPEYYISLNTAEMFLDQVRSVGLWRWSMCMDMEDQYDTVNGCQCITAEIRVVWRIRKSSILLCRKEGNSGHSCPAIRTAEKFGV